MIRPLNGSSLHADRELVACELARLLDERTMPAGSPVHEAMRYAVLGAGQRLRPVMAVRVGRMAGAEAKYALRAAAAVEILHCASLVVDDLPCMDDEAMRRDRPAVHVQFGESTALLASFGLVALAARAVVQDVEKSQAARSVRFQIQLLKVLDCSGLIEGQALDLRLRGESRDAQRDCLTELKTVPLFQLAVEAGLAFGDAPARMKTGLRQFARDFGLAYQMTDDLLDGEESDPERLASQYDRVRQRLSPFGAAACGLEEMLDYLHAKADEKNYCHR
ncbi:MAG: polyprenyl synthetase family protein [Bryobacteraceae bacterium]